MKLKAIVVIASLVGVFSAASAQVALKPWVQVYGTVKGQELGKYVLGITPSVSLPYRAAISRNGSTSFLRLQSPTDTAAQMTLAGEDPLVGDLNNDGWQDLVLLRSANNWDTVLVLVKSFFVCKSIVEGQAAFRHET